MSIYMTVSLLPLQIIYHSTHLCCLYPYFLKVTVLMLSALESVLTWQIEKIIKYLAPENKSAPRPSRAWLLTLQHERFSICEKNSGLVTVEGYIRNLGTNNVIDLLQNFR